MELVLKPLSVFNGEDIWRMMQEIGPGVNGFQNNGYNISLENFPDWLLSQIKISNSINVPNGKVLQYVYWLYQGPVPIGYGKLRPVLSEKLFENGGNIGFCLHPSFRNRGLGYVFLKLLIEKARDKGLDMVLVTVNSDNTASRKVVEKNGGLLWKQNSTLCWYWIYV